MLNIVDIVYFLRVCLCKNTVIIILQDIISVMANNSNLNVSILLVRIDHFLIYKKLFSSVFIFYMVYRYF